MKITLLWSTLTLFLKTQAQIKIISSESLIAELGNEGKIPASTATFGTPPYGESFIGALHYAHSNDSHCSGDYVEEWKRIRFESSLKNFRSILLLKRGGCSFVQKITVAQNEAEADCVIVIDDQSLIPIGKILMTDDGKGSKISIPSMLISQTSGNILMAHIQEPILLELEWNLPKKKEVVLELWHDSGNVVAQRFLRDFAPIAQQFGASLSFKVHFNIFSIEDDDQSASHFSNLCHENSFKFCAEPPNTNKEPLLTGRQVVMEDLRQLCLITAEDEAQEEGTQHPLWWSYVRQIPVACPLDGNDDKRFGRVCSENLLKNVAPLQILQQVDHCMRFRYVGLLELERQNKAWSSLALRINGGRYVGAIDSFLVTKAVCIACEDPPVVCSNYGPLLPKNSSNFPLYGGLFLFLTCLLVVGCCLHAHQKNLKRNMRDSLRHEIMLEVRSQMKEYQNIHEIEIPNRSSVGFGDFSFGRTQ